MGEIIGAGFLSHAPTIMLARETRYELNEGKEISLVPGLKKLRAEVFNVLKPDAVIVFDTHWYSTVEFLLTSHNKRAGQYTSEELPRGMRQLSYDLKGDPILAKLIADRVNAEGTRCTVTDDPYLPIHYPTINLAHYLNAGESWLSMSICQTAEENDFLTVGRAIGEAAEVSKSRIILIASGGMSHRFWSLRELPEHESSDPIHIRTPAARAADEQRIAWWEQGRHADVLAAMNAYYAHKPEGFFGHYLMMVGALGGGDCIAPGRKYSDYENAAGTGQLHMWFEKPEKGWMGVQQPSDAIKAVKGSHARTEKDTLQ